MRVGREGLGALRQDPRLTAGRLLSEEVVKSSLGLIWVLVPGQPGLSLWL